MMMIFAARVWSWWLSFPLLAAAVVTWLAIVVGYYRKVILACYRWKLWRQEQSNYRDLKPVTDWQAPKPTPGRRAA